MKFGQLTYIKTWEIFSLKRHAQNVAQKLVLDLFLKKQNWTYLWINSLKFVSIVRPGRGMPKHIEAKANHLLLLHIKIFQKTKRSLDRVSLPHFLHDFWRKIFLIYWINEPNFIVWLHSLFEISHNLFVALLVSACDVINFEIYPSVLIKPFSYIINNALHNQHK